MTTTTDNSQMVSTNEDVDAIEAIQNLTRNARSKSELYRQGFRAIAKHFQAIYATLQVDSASGTIQDRLQERERESIEFQKTCEGLTLHCQYQNEAYGRVFESKSSGQRICAIAAPLSRVTGSAEGVMLIAMPCGSREDVASRLSEFRALASLVASAAATLEGPRVEPKTSKSPDGAGMQAGLAKAAKYESLHELAFSMTNSLKGKLGCDQVSFSVIRNHRAKLLCISGLSTVNAKSPGAKKVISAMEECADAREIICYQHDENWSAEETSTHHRLHRAWHDNSGNSPVASVPILIDGRCYAVLSIRNPSSRPFRNDQLKKLRDIVEPLGPGMEMLERANRKLLAHVLASVRSQIARSLSRDGRLRPILAVAAMAFTFWFVFGKQDYIISVPCEVKAKEIRQFSAPFEGMIESVFVSPGDEVEVGQLLVQFNTDEIIAQRDAAQAELELAELEMTQALNEKQYAAAAQARARLQMAESKLSTTEHRMALADIRAPSNGIILSGDLRPRLGETVRQGEPLMQFAPPNSSSVELAVPEHLAVHMRSGQVGSFSTVARPDEQTTCEIERIAPASIIDDGRNVFVSVANTDDSPSWLKSGMEGVARVNTGRRPVWWVWLHRAIDSMRFAIWKL